MKRRWTAWYTGLLVLAATAAFADEANLPEMTACSGHGETRAGNVGIGDPIAVSVKMKAGNRPWEPVPENALELAETRYVCVGEDIQFEVVASDKDDHVCLSVTTAFDNYIKRTALRMTVSSDDEAQYAGAAFDLDTQDVDRMMIRTWQNTWRVPESAAGRRLTFRLSGQVEDWGCDAYTKSPKGRVRRDHTNSKDPDRDMGFFAVEVTVLKVKIDHDNFKICRGMPGDYTINLTSDSWTGGGDDDTDWATGSIIGGKKSAGSFSFTPAKQGAGGDVVNTAVTASAARLPTCSDSVLVTLYRDHWAPRATATINVNPGLETDDVKAAANLDKVVDTLVAQLDEIEKTIRQNIPKNEPDKADKSGWFTAWKKWNPTKTFAEFVEHWVASKLNEVADAIANAKKEAPVQVDLFCGAIAKEVNQKLNTAVMVQADYEYWCGEFDPATDGKGWTAVTVCDPDIEAINAGVKFGVDGLSITVEPLGVGASINVQGYVEFETSATLEPKGIPEQLQPGNVPAATSRVKMQLKVKASIAAVQTALMTFSPSGGVTLNKELAGPDGTGFPFKMVATKQKCCGASPIQ